MTHPTSELTPIQIIGTQRSGSNLLRLILNQSPLISAHHPPHILTVFQPLLPKYGNLEVRANFHRLVHDVCRLIETNPVPWKLELDRQEVLQACAKPTLIEVFKVVYEKMALQDGARFWCCKSMANVNYFEDLEANGLRPLYIHLVRDGRDVAASFKKTLVGEKHAYHLANVWKKNYRKAQKIGEAVGPDRFMVLKYEDLIASPEAALEALNAFFGGGIDASALDYFNSDESKVTAAAGTMWSNLTMPIMSGNSKKFLTVLSREELEIFESVAGEELRENGYDCITDAVKREFTAAEIQEFDRGNDALKREAQQATHLEVDRQCRISRNALLEELRAMQAV